LIYQEENAVFGFPTSKLFSCFVFEMKIIFLEQISALSDNCMLVIPNSVLAGRLGEDFFCSTLSTQCWH